MDDAVENLAAELMAEVRLDVARAKQLLSLHAEGLSYEQAMAAVPGLDCEHDWRVDPRVTLQSNPPSQRLVCARCGATATQMVSTVMSDDPRDWPKA